MITHDERMLDVCDRILTLRDGQYKRKTVHVCAVFLFNGFI